VVAHRPGCEPATFRSRSRRPTIEPPCHVPEYGLHTVVTDTSYTAGVSVEIKCFMCVEMTMLVAVLTS